MDLEHGLSLTVHVDADEWAYSQRRLTYLHCMLMRVVRDEHGVVEWYSADDLASLRLPGLPSSKQGIARKAKAGKWVARIDFNTGSRHRVYHVASLPARPFDTLISRILDMPDVEDDVLPIPDLRPGPEPIAIPMPMNTAPPWVLPLMRLMKGAAAGDLGTAWSMMPDHIPQGMQLPDVEEAAAVLVHFGLAGKS